MKIKIRIVLSNHWLGVDFMQLGQHLKQHRPQHPLLPPVILRVVKLIFYLLYVLLLRFLFRLLILIDDLCRDDFLSLVEIVEDFPSLLVMLFIRLGLLSFVGSPETSSLIVLLESAVID